MTFYSDWNNKRFQVVEELPEIGSHLIIYNVKDEFLEKYLKEDAWTCMDFALEKFRVPRDSWVMLTK